VLVLHDLLLGDTLMLAALLAALRARYPQARLYVTAAPALVPLFSGQPYGAQVLPFTERDSHALAGLAPAQDCDIAFIPGDNPLALTARALGARWIVAFGDARPGWKNWIADELIAFPAHPAALGDIFALLAGPATALRYAAGDWPAPAYKSFSRPAPPYAVLHVGARSPLRHWEPARWAQVAERLADKGFQVVWSAGPGETVLVQQIDPGQRYASYAGTLDLAQLWHLIAGAGLLVTLDTGIAHLAKLTGTRTVCIFGPGSAPLLGAGEFWKDAPFAAVTVPDFPCRDQSMLFKREVHWVRHCARSTAECSRARCMEAINVEDVLAAIPQ
jgi:ADP-heptose:LPS heptosyltransferase